jgi:hypothetical protein
MVSKTELVSSVIHNGVCGLFDDRVDPPSSWEVCDRTAVNVIAALKNRERKITTANKRKQTSKTIKRRPHA